MSEYQIHVSDDDILDVETLGTCEFDSPLTKNHFISDEERVVITSRRSLLRPYIDAGKEVPSFERAGPRKKIYHDPSWTKAAIVTCGGLCPGLNDVIRGIVLTLYHTYGVTSPILGIRYGFQGLNPKSGFKPMMLTPESVKNIHNFGGTILGSSRGKQDISVMVNTLVRQNINMLFCIGGDGTLKGTHYIAQEILKRKLKISVIGVPKTIDNDISFVEKTFGFDTAVQQAAPVISAAHTEALGAMNGVGLVKLMGRESGWIAAKSTLALADVNFVLIPEAPFSLDKLLDCLMERLKSRGHAVIVVAEGAGQDILMNQGDDVKKDKSGNPVFKDIGLFLKQQIIEHYKKIGLDSTVKYIDPSYIIRSSPANSTDSVFCHMLSQSAVHAAMAGKTDILVGTWNEFFTHIPIKLAVRERKKVDLTSRFWNSVVGSTGQPDLE